MSYAFTDNLQVEEFIPTDEDYTYNGWTNYETWNVSLWIQNDEDLYKIAKTFRHSGYRYLIQVLYDHGSTETPDGVKWNDPDINIQELDEMLMDL